MIASTLSTFVLVLSSLAAANGAVVQRDGTFTFLTPQPTLATAATSTSTSTSSTSTVRTTTTSATTTSATTTSATTTSTSAPTTVPTTTTSTATAPVTTASVTTSSVTQSKTIPITSTPSARPTSGAVSCDGVQQWQSAFAYSAGNNVIFNNQLFTAKQWTYANAPPSHPDQWTLVGTCSQPIANKANCNGVAAWDKNVAYNTGNQVTFNNHLWSAVQWTFANSPGDASGSWQDRGACA